MQKGVKIHISVCQQQSFLGGKLHWNSYALDFWQTQWRKSATFIVSLFVCSYTFNSTSRKPPSAASTLWIAMRFVSALSLVIATWVTPFERFRQYKAVFFLKEKKNHLIKRHINSLWRTTWQSDNLDSWHVVKFWINMWINCPTGVKY